MVAVHPTPSKWLQKRLSAINRRGTPELKAALANGYLSSHVAETLAYRPPQEQRSRVAELVARKDRLRARCRIVALVLERHTKSGNWDSLALRREVREALALQEKSARRGD
jgi:hypothetical protein